MFIEPLPESVDPYRLADENVVLEGEIPLSDFERLVNYLAERSGVVRVKLQFHKGKHNIVIIVGQIQATLAMQCQYCLDPVKVAVNTNLDLVLMDNDDASGSGEEQDAILLQGDRIELTAIVEDDLILSLPMVARHGSGDCIGKLEYDQTEGPGDRPFAELERLKQKFK